MASDRSDNFEGPERAVRFHGIKQEPPVVANPQGFPSGHAPAAPAGPSAAATQDDGRSAPPLAPTHDAAIVTAPSQHPGPVHGDGGDNGAGGQFIQPFAALPDTPPQGDAAMMGVLNVGGNGAGQREFTGPMRTQARRPAHGLAAQAANNPHRIAPVNRRVNPPNPAAALPQHPAQQGYVAGPSHAVYPGNPLAGAAYAPGPWGPQVLAGFVNNAGMGFGQNLQGPTYPGVWGLHAFANLPPRALVPYGGAPQHPFFAGPPRPQGYRMMPPHAAAQFASVAAIAPQVPGPGAYAPQAGFPQNPAPPVQPQPDPGAVAAIVAQAGPSHAAPLAAAPQVPSVDHPTERGAFECVHCRARFAQYPRCFEHVITAHVIPEFTRQMSEVATMIHAVPDADA